MSKTIFRGGKAVARSSVSGDGRVLLEKAITMRPEHIMNMTGTPGWDVSVIDELFTRGVDGSLRFIYDGVQYDINITDFRAHAFAKDIPPHGPQYHCAKKHWSTHGLRTVSPKRDEAPALPKQLAFGEWVPCGSCKGRGCDVCARRGYVPWKP